MSKIDLREKARRLPTSPGVYCFLNLNKKIIYVGKAKNLKARVYSYFSKQIIDNKTEALVSKISEIKFIKLQSEFEAILLEAEYIKRYQPLYNVLGKDEKNFCYIRITSEEFPKVYLTRNLTKNLNGDYFGPFRSMYLARSILNDLKKIILFIDNRQWPKIPKIYFQIKRLPNPDIAVTDYQKDIKKLKKILSGDIQSFEKELYRNITKAAKTEDYLLAKMYRNKLYAIQSLKKRHFFEDSDIAAQDIALKALAKHLGLKTALNRIECIDISNINGTDPVASLVVFKDGLPSKVDYRKLAMRAKGPDDFAMIAESVHRRFSGRLKILEPPDLLIVDGGKGQVISALKALEVLGVDVPLIGLAKRFETIVTCTNGNFSTINLDHRSPELKLLQRIRDEAHRFAITFHRVKRHKRQFVSLENVPGIGPKLKKKLLLKFASLDAVINANEADLSTIIGLKRTQALKQYFKDNL